MIEVRNLRFGYVPEIDILKDINFTIGEGEFIALGGCNGCGKTTVTRLLTGLEQPKGGKIFYNGEDITTVPAYERGEFIGYVFQQPDRQMFKGTVKEEVAFGPQQLGFNEVEVESIVQEAMDRAGVAHLADEYPPLLRRGEKQRVAIASALAMQSKLLILDEPTSGQDGKETSELLVLLNELLADGLSILLVTHDMEVIASHCTRAIVIGHGTKAFDGTPEELFTTCEELTELGLTKPPCVELAETVPGLGYCKSMDEFTRKLLAFKGKPLGGMTNA